MYLGKQHISDTLNSASLSAAHGLSVRASDGASASHFKLKLNYRLLYLTSFFKALHMKFVTCLEQIVICTSSTAAQSVSISYRCACIKLCISILRVLPHIVSLIKKISIYRTNSILLPSPRTSNTLYTNTKNDIKSTNRNAPNVNNCLEQSVFFTFFVSAPSSLPLPSLRRMNSELTLVTPVVLETRTVPLTAMTSTYNPGDSLVSVAMEIVNR